MTPGRRRWRLWSLLFATWAGWASPALACVADGQVAVSLSLSQAICEASPKHVANAACCSGTASPVWNAATGKCDTTCDSSDKCAGVVCTPLDQCHLAGTCSSATGLCSNPAKTDGSPCTDANSCTSGDACTAGTCVSGSPIGGCCGNGSIDAGEECDDGNQSGDPPDGCGAGCTIDDSWQCGGEPSSCCLDVGALRFTLPGLNQSQCESIKGSDDAGCCEGSHKGVWTGATCNVVCSVNLCKFVSCQPPDGCHASGDCDPNTGICSNPPLPPGVICAGETACTAGGTCDGQGNCIVSDKAGGTPCAFGQCTLAQCDGFGSCMDFSDVLNGQSCDDGNYCTIIDQCVSGQCEGSSPVVCQPYDDCHVGGVCDPETGACSLPPAPAGAPCGNTSAQGACDQADACDGAGTCLANHVGNGTPCGSVGDPGCFTPGACADGACLGEALQPSGTACGNVQPLGVCDTGDTCDGTGHCRPNLLGAATVCRSAAGACDVAETCDGTNPACPADAFKPAGTVCGPGSADCSDQCNVAGGCETKCGPVTTTSTSLVGASNTTTTVPAEDACDGVVGIARARCLIDVALAAELCPGEAIPAKLDRALRAQLMTVAKRLEAAEGSDGRKRVRLLKKARAVLTAIDRKVSVALESKRSDKRISSACQGEIGGLVDAVEADAS